MPQSASTTSKMGKQALVIGGIAAVIVFALCCAAGAAASAGILPVSAQEPTAIVMLCVVSFAAAFLSAAAAPGKKLIAGLLPAVVLWLVLFIVAMVLRLPASGMIYRAIWIFGAALVAGFLASLRKKRRKY